MYKYPTSPIDAHLILIRRNKTPLYCGVYTVMGTSVH